ncbi:LuxR family two component transcriptional regulator [Kribbella rubisoli]|uniref:LuxR family two component transcriptional regulator n=1 Tax=Kribbella rubisoli TaxID=3075929 RepID=A0A4Q7WU32_9ACTN|nr:response regulator transcription factor [Kribbella rubisoli]RZU13912.1 LuxR family two component transcriptional regulator [Kribbella rubisoli]
MIRVLVVDDHEIVRTGLRQLLAGTDDLDPVGAAAGGDEGVAMVAQLHPDVVLMDLSMPGTDGIAATERIVADNPGTHVLVLTSFSDHDRIVAALDAGAEGYLLKNSTAEAILGGIRQLVAGGSPLDPIAAREFLTGRRLPPKEITFTNREQEVLEMLGSGLPNRAIAQRLGISERTVKAHLTNIFHRLGVTDRTQAALWAQRHSDH